MINRSGKIIRRGLWGLVATLLVLAIALLSNNIKSQLSDFATASSDNVQWVLSQSDVEILSLSNSVRAASIADDPDLNEVRVKFDIFYSRIMTFRESSVFAELRSIPKITRNLNRLSKFLNDSVPLIDADDQTLQAGLPAFAEDVEVARELVREVSLMGIEVFSEMSDNRRESVTNTLIYVALVTAALIVTLVILIFALNRLVQISEANARRSRENQDRLETVISTSLDAVIVIDPNGRVIEYNGAAERIFGYCKSEAIGQEMADLIIPDHLRSAHSAGMARFQNGGAPRVVNQGIVQLEAKRKNGEVFPIDLSIAAAKRPEGTIYVGFIRDISSRVAAENELVDARDKAIEGERSKANMLAIMSHEMRTPLNGMLGTLDLFDTEKLDPRHRRYLKVVRNSGDVLLGHVNDVLDISRIDANKLSMRRQHFDLEVLFQDLIEGQAAKAYEHGNEVILEPIPPELHNAYSDPSRVHQILTNLLANAIKFTRNGQITIEVDCHRGLDDVEVRVIDNGIGIPSEDLERIFSDFVTIDSSYARENSGTGLGLSISRRLATALGGEIGAESEIGDGSVFWLRLPMSAPAGEKGRRKEPHAHDTPEVVVRPLKVLLVEDNAINRLVAREMLERDGHEVTEAHDGREGVAFATQAKFDVILMDISMPEMDGVTATNAIRESKKGSWYIPIVATTAHVLEEDVKRFRDAGMSEVLSKPISIASLRSTLASVLVEKDDPEADEPSQQKADTPLIDWDQARIIEESLQRHQLITHIVSMQAEINQFLEVLPDQIDEPTQFDEIRSEAHRLAGSTAVFGLAKMAGLLRSMEYEAKNEAADSLQSLHSEATECWNETRKHFFAESTISPSELEEAN